MKRNKFQGHMLFQQKSISQFFRRTGQGTLGCLSPAQPSCGQETWALRKIQQSKEGENQGGCSLGIPKCHPSLCMVPGHRQNELVCLSSGWVALDTGPCCCVPACQLKGRRRGRPDVLSPKLTYSRLFCGLWLLVEHVLLPPGSLRHLNFLTYSLSGLCLS